MRLIDADKLNLEYEVDMAEDWNTAHEMANIVKYAPTIEAIPIEWLCSKYLDITSKSWSNGIRIVLNKVIDDWVKENV